MVHSGRAEQERPGTRPTGSRDRALGCSISAEVLSSPTAGASRRAGGRALAMPARWLPARPLSSRRGALPAGLDPCGLRSLGRVLPGVGKIMSGRSINRIARRPASPSSGASVATRCGHLTAKAGAQLRHRVAAPEKWPSWLTRKMPSTGPAFPRACRQLSQMSTQTSRTPARNVVASLS